MPGNRLSRGGVMEIGSRSADMDTERVDGFGQRWILIGDDWVRAAGPKIVAGAPLNTDDFNETPCPHCPDAFDQGIGYGHRADCPTFTEPHAIVRELAAQDAPVVELVGHFVDLIGCVLCGSNADFPKNDSSPDLSTPGQHALSCLWRRARELYPPAE